MIETRQEATEAHIADERCKSILVRLIVIEIKHHAHFNNLFTHIAKSRWDELNAAFRHLFDVEQKACHLNTLTRNLVGLLTDLNGPSAIEFRAWFNLILEAEMSSDKVEVLRQHWLDIAQSRVHRKYDTLEGRAS